MGWGRGATGASGEGSRVGRGSCVKILEKVSSTLHRAQTLPPGVWRSEVGGIAEVEGKGITRDTVVY